MTVDTIKKYSEDPTETQSPTLRPDGDEEDTADMMEEKVANDIAREKTNDFQRSRLLTYGVVALVIVAIALGVHFYIRNQEQADFEQQFQEDANKILESFGTNLDILLEATQSLAVSTISFAKATNQTFPFVTIPDFASRMSIIAGLSHTTWTTLYYTVEHKDRPEWEAYSHTNNYWVDETIRFQETDPSWKGPIFYNYTNFDVIHDYGEYEKDMHEQGTVGSDDKDVYYPNWQNYPIVPDYAPYNWDLGSVTDGEFISESLEGKRALVTYSYLGQVYKNASDPLEVEEMGYEVDWIQDYIDPEEIERADEPVADLIYPLVVNKADSSVITDANYDAADAVSVGMYSITYYWRHLLRDLLPEGSNGLYIVMDHCLPTPFTYRIDGAFTTYEGAGDRHEPGYDDLKVESTLLELVHPKYNGVPLHKEHCPYTIRIYPSQQFRDGYTSSAPAIAAVVAVIVVALLITMAFVLNDCLIQRKRMAAANSVGRN